MPIRRIRKTLLSATVCLMAVACSSDEEVYVERKVEFLYNTAVNSLEAQEFKDAATEFEEVERQHPYSVWAVKAKLCLLYTSPSPRDKRQSRMPSSA